MTVTLTEEHRGAAVYVAGIIGSFNALENVLIGIFQKAFGGNGEESYVLLGRLQNANSRLEVIEDYLKFRSSEVHWISGVLPLLQQVREASAYRNRVAHGMYISDGDRLMIGENLFNTRKAKSREVRELSVDELRGEYDKINALTMSLLTASGMMR